MKSKLSLTLGLLIAVALFIILRKQDTAPTLPGDIEIADSVETTAPEQPAGDQPLSPAPSQLVATDGETQPLVSPEKVTEPLPTSASLDSDLADPLVNIPASVLRTQLAALPASVRQKALQKLEELSPPNEDFGSLRVTPDGKFFYANDAPLPATRQSLSSSQVSNRASAAAAARPGTAAASVPVASPPIHHSKPGSTNVIYLDFNGHTITGTSWNVGNGALATYVGKAFDLDGDATTFNDAEQAIITEVWERVSEDYSPFDIDVTTEEPGTFTTTTGHALITSKLDASGNAMPSNDGGGVAFTGVFGDSDYVTQSSPAFTYYDNLGNTADAIADATSHEVGHNMGLTHDGQAAEEYYDGHGTGDTAWGPIMGSPYSQNVSQWSKGEYLNSTNTQDDLAIVSAKTPYRSDEAGGTLPTAASANVTGSNVSNLGVIANSADLDLYSFSTASGSVSFTATTYRAATGTHGVNADIKLELLDSTGSVVATDDPSGTTNATLTHTATSGTYYVRVSPASEGTPTANPPSGYTTYGSAGQYTLTGTIVAAAPSITSATTDSVGAGSNYSYSIVGTNGPTSYQATGLPTGLSVDTNTGVITGRPTAVGLFNISLSATNSLGTGMGALALTVTDSAPVITAQTSGRVTVTPGAAQSLSVTTLSANGTPTYQWQRNGRAIAGATNATFDLSTLTPGGNGYYRVSATNTIGTTVSDVVFVLYAPTTTEVTGWGLNTSGQRNIPANLTDAIDVVTGATHSLALKADGTVVAWGSNNDGESTVPAGLTNVVKLAAGIDVSFALKADGTVTAWGSPGFVIGNPPDDLTDVVDITASSFFALALKSDGSIVTWGDNSSGQLTVPGNVGTVIDIASGSSTSYALNSVGTLFGFGNNGNGETNVPAASTAWSTVSGGGFHGHALKDDGTVTGWGFSGSSTPPSGLSDAVAISSGFEHSLALSSTGSISIWGDSSNASGEMNIPSGLDKVFAIAAGKTVSLAINEIIVPQAPAITGQPQAQTVLTGADVTFSVTATGTPAPTYQWRKDSTPINGATAASLQLTGVSAANAGSYDVVVTNDSGSATSDSALLTVQTAPAFSTHPQSQTVDSGASVMLTSVVTGVPSPTLQWRKDGAPIDGATGSSLDLGAVSPGANGDYDVVATNSVGSTTSTAATVRVLFGPSINPQPASQTVTAGNGVTFTVAATGDPAPTYQWRKGGVDIDGATNTSFTIASTVLADAADYDVVVTSGASSLTSDTATLTVNLGAAITSQPEGQTVTVGTQVTLSVTATGTPAPTYQWRKGGVDISGATAASLDLGSVALTDSGDYDVIVSNSIGNVTSAVATVTVQAGPAITTQPISQTVQASTSVAFTVVATGTPAPTYQWRKDGADIPDATSSSFGLSDVSASDAGSYTVAVTNVVGTVISEAADLVIISVTATQSSGGYRLGSTATINNTITYTGALTGLVWSVVPPADVSGTKWTLSAINGTPADTSPNIGDTDLLEWTWTTVPTSPFTFSYDLDTPSATTGTHNITAMFDATSVAGTLQGMVSPDPLALNEAPTVHTADTDEDLKINLSELLRVIELYNTRLGTTRTGRYKVDPTTADGFAPDPTSGDTPTSFHAGDTDRDSQINLSELLRVIELYNTRSGTTRTGEYHIDSSTTDGFAPGPIPE